MDEVLIEYLHFNASDWEEHRDSLFLLVSSFLKCGVKSQNASILFEILSHYQKESEKLIRYFSERDFHQYLRRMFKNQELEEKENEIELRGFRKEITFLEDMIHYIGRIEEIRNEESPPSYILEFDYCKEKEFHFISELVNFGVEFFQFDDSSLVQFLIYMEPCDLSLHCVNSLFLNHPKRMKSFMGSLIHHYVNDIYSCDRVEKIVESIIEMEIPQVLFALRKECTERQIMIKNIFFCSKPLGDGSIYMMDLFTDSDRSGFAQELSMVVSKVKWFRDHLLNDGIFGDHDETRTVTDLRVLCMIANNQTNLLLSSNDDQSKDEDVIMAEAEELEELGKELNKFHEKWYTNQKIMDVFIVFLFFHMKFDEVRPVVTNQLGLLIPRIWKDQNLSFYQKKLVVFLASIFYSKMDDRLVHRVEGILDVSKVDLSLEETDLFSGLIIDEFVPLEGLAHYLLQGRPEKREDRAFVLEKIYFFLQYKVLRKFPGFGGMMKNWFLNGHVVYLAKSGESPDSLLAPFLDEWVSNCVPVGNQESILSVFTADEFLLFLEDCERRSVEEGYEVQIEVVKCVLLYYSLSLITHVRVPRSWKFPLSFLERLGVLPLTRFVWMRRKQLGSFGRYFIGKILKHCPSLFELQVTLGGERDVQLVFVDDRGPDESSSDRELNDKFKDVLSNPLEDQAKTRMVFYEILESFSNAGSRRRKKKGKEVGRLRIRSRNEEMFLNLLLLLLKSGNHRPPENYLMEAYEKLWISWYRSWPLRIALKTLNVLHAKKVLTHEEVMKDVFMVFRVKKEVFHCSALFPIFLHLLLHFMSFTEKMWSGQGVGEGQEGPPGEGQNKMKDEGGEKSDNLDGEGLEIRKRLVYVEQSTLLQLLLEVCLFTKSDQVRKMICEFFHHRFIEKPILAKLIHFQGYRLELLPLVTKYVQSIHICYDFLHELLDHGDIDKKVFGIHLASFIIKKNNMSNYIPMARAVIDKIRILGVKGTGSESRSHRNMVLCCFDPLRRLVKAYPFLSGEVVDILKEISLNFKNDFELNEKIRECFSNLLDDVLIL